MMTGIKLMLCFLSSLICCAAFGAFLALGNYFSAIWGLLAAFINALATHVHWLKYKNKLELWYARRDLFKLMMIGTTFFIIGTSGLVYHIVIQILQNPPLLPVSHSNYIPMIWAFITLKSGLFLAYNILSYKSDFNESLINEGEEEDVESNNQATTDEATEQREDDGEEKGGKAGDEDRDGGAGDGEKEKPQRGEESS